MLRKLLVLSFSLSLLGCASQLPNSAQTRLPMRPDLQTFTLENGLKVYLLPRAQAGVEMRLLVNSGSVQENQKQLGFSHFTEHMAFKGTTHFPGTSGFKQLESLGMKLGSHVNAATSLNTTTYQLSLPNANPVQVATGLQILSDWAFNMTFDPVEFDKERSVIVEEWRLRQGVGFRINNQLEALRYQGSRYAERNPIGDLNIIQQGDVKDAKAYYHTWYQPQRMALVVVGDFNQGETLAHIQRLFNSQAPVEPAIDDPNWKQFATQSQLLVKPIFDKEQGARFVQFSLQRNLEQPLNTKAGHYADLMDALWLSILNQRFSTLVDNGLIPSVSANEQGAMLDNRRSQQLMIAHPKGADYQGAVDIIFTEVQRLATAPVSQAELDQARNTLLKRLSQQAAGEQRYEHAYLIEQITQALELDLPIHTKQQALNLANQLVKPVTPAQLQSYFAEYLAQTSARLALIGPDSDAPNFNQQILVEQWNRMRQTQLPAFSLKTQAVELNLTPALEGKITQQNSLPIEQTQAFTLSNGMRVIVKNDRHLTDNVQLSLRIPGGASLEADNSLGMVQWALKLPEVSGYGAYSARELALFSKQHQVSLRPYSELLFHGYQGEAPVDEVETLLKLLHLKITVPLFSGQKLEQQKQAMALAITNVPVERAFLDQINQASFVNGQRMVISEQGAWRQFNVQQLQQTNQLILGQPADMTLVIAGPVAIEQIKPLLKRWVASLPSQSKQRLYWVDAGIAPKLAMMQKSYPQASSNKTMVSLQYVASAQWTQEQALALNLLNTIVSQRLRLKLREQAGGVYALSFSGMLTKYPTSYYTGRLNFTTAPERADELVELARQTLTQVKQQGITAQELQEAKNIWLTENLPLRDSATYWAQALAQVATDDQNYTQLIQEPALVQKIDTVLLNKLAQQWLGEHEKLFKLTPP